MSMFENAEIYTLLWYIVPGLEGSYSRPTHNTQKNTKKIPFFSQLGIKRRIDEMYSGRWHHTRGAVTSPLRNSHGAQYANIVR